MHRYLLELFCVVKPGTRITPDAYRIQNSYVLYQLSDSTQLLLYQYRREPRACLSTRVVLGQDDQFSRILL
jgi:hypothetical protein